MLGVYKTVDYAEIILRRIGVSEYKQKNNAGKLGYIFFLIMQENRYKNGVYNELLLFVQPSFANILFRKNMHCLLSGNY